MYIRAPLFFHEPRLWAEEGSVYLLSAMTSPWQQALLAPHLGYYALFANSASLIAWYVGGLLHAPAITTWLAFLVQLLPCSIILWGNSELWEHSPWQRLFALLTCLMLGYSEVWLNTINSQIFFALSTALILSLKTPDRPITRWGLGVGLIFMGLSSPLPGFLTPLYWFRWFRQREPWRLGLALLLTITFVVQIITTLNDTSTLAVRGIHQSVAWWNRAHPSYPPLIALILAMRLFISPFLPGAAYNQLITVLLQLIELNTWLLELDAFIAMSVMAASLWQLVYRAKQRYVLWPIAAALLLACTATIFSLGTERVDLLFLTKERYYLAPITLILIGVIAIWPANQRIRWFSIASVSLALSLSLWDSQRVLPNDYAWSRWELEVAHYRVDPTYQPRIWPAGSSIDLSQYAVNAH
jgi:hypothetical protein